MGSLSAERLQLVQPSMTYRLSWRGKVVCSSLVGQWRIGSLRNVMRNQHSVGAEELVTGSRGPLPGSHAVKSQRAEAVGCSLNPQSALRARLKCGRRCVLAVAFQSGSQQATRSTSTEYSIFSHLSTAALKFRGERRRLVP